VVAGAVGVEFALLQFAGVEAVGRADRMVVADDAVARQDLVDHVLPVDAYFSASRTLLSVKGSTRLSMTKV
jgi:hypothetical protein